MLFLSLGLPNVWSWNLHHELVWLAEQTCPLASLNWRVTCWVCSWHRWAESKAGARYSVCPSVLARITATHPTMWCSSEASSCDQSRPGRQECAPALSCGSTGILMGLIFLMCLWKCQRSSSVWAKGVKNCHTHIAVLKKWVKNLTAGRQKANQTKNYQSPPCPTKKKKKKPKKHWNKNPAHKKKTNQPINKNPKPAEENSKRRMYSVEQSGVGIMHGEIARTICQVTMKECAWSITASQEMRERHSGNSLKEVPEKAKQFFFCWCLIEYCEKS